MLDANVSKLLNEQIKNELYSAYLYLDFSLYYKEEGLDGFANWYMIQTQEERDIYDTKRSRWGKGRKNNISYLEFDSNIDLSVNQFVNIDPNIFDLLSVGDSIILKRRINGGNVDYEIIHEDTETGLGYIEKPFIEDIKAFNHTEDLIEMPSIVSDIYISGIYSKVVDSEWLETHPEIAGVSLVTFW